MKFSVVFFSVALVALVGAGQTPLQRRVLREVVEYFNGRNSGSFVFKEQTVEGAVEREDSSGTFVQLKVTLVQTTCRKRSPQRHNCRALENRRKPSCLVCYKFDPSDVPKVVDKYHNCGPSHHLAVKELRQRDEAECRAVEDAGKASESLYLPGMFAFSKGLPA
ncbi:retinoic acid receptor responder protein 2 [Cuculus canorus]|uniref:retinoic acid receptor responder protein 2 n=1 Tax=Cuculus canorus TaxID=55661 RepID=UPI0023AA2A8A|nr:retinoic acid receptor responder protein 2 [Cuculus canorus]